MLCRMQAAGLVDRIIREHADDIMDADKAVRRVEAERHSQLASAQVCSSALHMLNLLPATRCSYTEVIVVPHRHAPCEYGQLEGGMQKGVDASTVH